MDIKFSPQDKIKGLKLSSKITTELAYLIGVFIGDGSIGYRPEKREYHLSCVGNPKDEKEFYFKVLSPYFKKVFGFIPNIRHHDQRTTFGFKVYSKALVEYLTKVIGLPLGKKYDSLKIPFVFKKIKN